MSIDISSAIPVIHTIDIKINKDEESQTIKPIEESYESDNSNFQFNREGFAEVIRDNFRGIGDTYNTKGELVTEARRQSNSDNKNTRIDVFM